LRFSPGRHPPTVHVHLAAKERREKIRRLPVGMKDGPAPGGKEGGKGGRIQRDGHYIQIAKPSYQRKRGEKGRAAPRCLVQKKSGRRGLESFKNGLRKEKREKSAPLAPRTDKVGKKGRKSIDVSPAFSHWFWVPGGGRCRRNRRKGSVPLADEGKGRRERGRVV